jgi:hypothetical protein
LSQRRRPAVSSRVRLAQPARSIAWSTIVDEPVAASSAWFSIGRVALRAFARRARPRRAPAIGASGGVSSSSSPVCSPPTRRGAPTGDGASRASGAATVTVAPGTSLMPSSRALTCARTIPPTASRSAIPIAGSPSRCASSTSSSG